jgi:hypothetical protein
MAYMKKLLALLILLAPLAAAQATTTAFPPPVFPVPVGTRAPMVGGSYVFTYGVTYAATPVCVAVPEGTLSLGLIQVAPTTTTCTVTSAVGADTRTVDIFVIGTKY